ncbi:hypothetical protein CU044_4247 [Streptomyces sp. L-9-10]|nr:hypothetical protein CU044_4247 [Streptomyces sp. L-9-10]
MGDRMTHGRAPQGRLGIRWTTARRAGGAAVLGWFRTVGRY